MISYRLISKKKKKKANSISKRLRKVIMPPYRCQGDITHLLAKLVICHIEGNQIFSYFSGIGQ